MPIATVRLSHPSPPQTPCIIPFWCMNNTHTLAHIQYRPCDLSFLITFAAVGRNNITILYIHIHTHKHSRGNNVSKVSFCGCVCVCVCGPTDSYSSEPYSSEHALIAYVYTYYYFPVKTRINSYPFISLLLRVPTLGTYTM